MKVGNITVFTKEGAVEAFRTFQEICYKNISIESAAIMTDIEKDMLKLGFTYQDLEKLDNEYWQSC